jgi:hypothetical protein
MWKDRLMRGSVFVSRLVRNDLSHRMSAHVPWAAVFDHDEAMIVEDFHRMGASEN